MVSAWWRAWLHFHVVGFRITMKQAIWYITRFIYGVLKAVPCPHSCQRLSLAEP